MATRPNEILTWDYLDMGVTGEGDFNYILVLKDSFSGFVYMAPCQAQNASTSAQHMMDWISLFGLPKVVMSDNGTPFTAQVVRDVLGGWNVGQYFTTAYCPFSNGCIERVNRDIKKMMHTLMSVHRLEMDEWPQMVPIVQSMVNQRPAPRLDNKAPITVFTGHPRTEPMDAIRLVDDTFKHVNWDERPGKLELIRRQAQEVGESLEAAYEVVVNLTKKAQIRNQNRVAKKCKGFHADVGDYMLARIKQPGNTRKLQVNWQGPFLLVEHKNEKVEILEPLIGDKTRFEVHHRLLKRYRSADTELLDQWLQQAAYDLGSLEIESITQIRWSDTHQRFEFLVDWVGLPSPTWETVEAVLDDDPAMAKAFMVKAVKSWSSGELRSGDLFPWARMQVMRDEMIRVIIRAFGDSHNLSPRIVPEREIEYAVEDIRRGKKVPRCLARLR